MLNSAPLKADDVSEQTFTQERIVYQIGVAPIRIDILTTISGVGFAEAWQNRVETRFFGVPVHFISLRHLVANKRAAGRATDLLDLKSLIDEASGEPPPG